MEGDEEGQKLLEEANKQVQPETKNLNDHWKMTSTVYQATMLTRIPYILPL